MEDKKTYICGYCGIRTIAKGHASGKCQACKEKDQEEANKQTTRRIQAYFTEKDLSKRLDVQFIWMLEGLVKMLEVWGNLECKGGGCIDPRDQLFHCRACVINGIKGHVEQAIQNWKARS